MWFPQVRDGSAGVFEGTLGCSESLAVTSVGQRASPGERVSRQKSRQRADTVQAKPRSSVQASCVFCDDPSVGSRLVAAWGEGRGEGLNERRVSGKYYEQTRSRQRGHMGGRRGNILRAESGDVPWRRSHSIVPHPSTSSIQEAGPGHPPSLQSWERARHMPRPTAHFHEFQCPAFPHALSSRLLEQRVPAASYDSASRGVLKPRPGGRGPGQCARQRLALQNSSINAMTMGASVLIGGVSCPL